MNFLKEVSEYIGVASVGKAVGGDGAQEGRFPPGSREQLSYFFILFSFFLSLMSESSLLQPDMRGISKV